MGTCHSIVPHTSCSLRQRQGEVEDLIAQLEVETYQEVVDDEMK